MGMSMSADGKITKTCRCMAGQFCPRCDPDIFGVLSGALKVKPCGCYEDSYCVKCVKGATITVSDPHGDLLREIRDLLREIRAYSETTADYLAGLYDRGK